MKVSIDMKSGKIAETSTKDIIAGIDLGTTHSLIAYIDNQGQPQTVKTGDGKQSLTPSIIHFDERGQLIVGEVAKQYLISQPERTIFSVKRLMGKSYNDISEFRSSLGYEIIDNDNDSLVKIKVDNQFYSPIELSAEILKSLKIDAEKALGTDITKAVITVPAYFNDAQRQATRDAGKLAGLDVLRIVNEPTAASLAYGIGIDRNQSMNIAVYDLGGGTFDISILHIEDGIFEVLSTHGDTFLGGDDFDRAIVQYWTRILNLNDVKLQNDAALGQSLRIAAEQAKKAVCSHNVYEGKVYDYLLKLDESTFNELAFSLVDKTIDSCKKAVQDAKLAITDINKVILVGGSTRIPLVKERLSQFFEQTPDDSMNPDEVVALGAAIQADILAGNRKDILLLDVTPLSLGIETVGGLMDSIITRNAKVPHRAARQYTTSIDGQKNLRISVFQGERDLVVHNRKLGEFTLRNIPPMPAGIPKIEVQFLLDADGILTVKAKELRSGTETSVEIKSAYSISEEEMAKMLLDSIRNAASDVNQRALLEAINEANNLVLSADKFVVQNASILSKEEVESIVSLNGSLKNAIKNQNKNDIESAMQALNVYTTPLAHKALDQNIQHALKSTTIS